MAMFWPIVLTITLGTVKGNSITVDLSNQDLTLVTTGNIDDNATDVVLSHNNITQVHDHDFANLPALNTLDMGKNLISSVSKLAFVNSTHVRKLDFSHNELSCVCDLSFPELSLVNVILDENPIVEIHPEDLEGFPTIYSLRLRDTGITAFPNCTYIGDTLGFISVNKNNIPIIDPDLLATAPKLANLELIATGLTSIPDLSTFPGRFELEYLNFNYIWHIGQTIDAPYFDLLPVLKFFYLEYSSLTEFTDFGSAKATLKEIHLSGNQIAVVDSARLQGMPHLAKLILPHNLITSFPDVRALGLRLEKLDLMNNRLVCDSTTQWIGEALAHGDIGEFLVDDPCDQHQQSGVFSRESLGAGSPIDDDERSVCVCRCMLEATCVAVSFQPDCVLEQQLPPLPASQQWWLRNM